MLLTPSKNLLTTHPDFRKLFQYLHIKQKFQTRLTKQQQLNKEETLLVLFNTIITEAYILSIFHDITQKGREKKWWE